MTDSDFTGMGRYISDGQISSYSLCFMCVLSGFYRHLITLIWQTIKKYLNVDYRITDSEKQINELAMKKSPVCVTKNMPKIY